MANDLAAADADLRKAAQLAEWCAHYESRMCEAARVRDLAAVERNFVVILFLSDAMFDSMVRALIRSGHRVLAKLMKSERDTDPLLVYMHEARNAESHDSLLKWQPLIRHGQLRIVDPQRTAAIAGSVATGVDEQMALFRAVFDATSADDLGEKFLRGTTPDAKRLLAAGVEFDGFDDSLALDAFTVRRRNRAVRIEEPMAHRGEFLPPSASVAVEVCMKTFRRLLRRTRIAVTAAQGRRDLGFGASR